MKILLIGEYSNLHWSLAEGLRSLGHDVTVASNGDGFKDYKRDIDLLRKSSGIKDTLDTLLAVIKNLHNFKGYDVVQLINPCFTQLNIKINALLYRFLKRHNKKVFLGAFGVDSFWIKACLQKDIYKYSEFFINGKENHLADNERLKHLWLKTSWEDLNIEIADTCNGIIACLYEYYKAYESFEVYSDKLKYIPLPIKITSVPYQENKSGDIVKFFIGINKDRSEFKGTNIMLKALERLCHNYEDRAEMLVAESVPYNEYKRMMQDSNVVLDQLYSYTPAMNGLLAMAMGKVLVGGGEPEMYTLLNEEEIKPIINVFPSEDDVYKKLEWLLLNKEQIPSLGEQSRLFVEKYHDYKKVALQYISFWNEMN